MNNLFSNQLLSQFQQFKSNPMSFLIQRNINIPQQFQNNPEAAVNYLLNNDLMTQEQFNQLAQMASKFRFQ